VVSIEDLIRSIVREELAKTQPAANPDNLTVDGYAAKWRISPSTVRAAIREKRLDVTRIGKAIRIAADARIRSTRGPDATTRAQMTLLSGGRVR
jgi:hypothetical protein